MKDSRRPVRATSDEEKGLQSLRNRLGQIQFVLSRVLERRVDADVEWIAEALVREIYGADVAVMMLLRRRGESVTAKPAQSGSSGLPAATLGVRS